MTSEDGHDHESASAATEKSTSQSPPGSSRTLWAVLSVAALALVIGLLSFKLFLSTAESSSAASAGGVVLLPSAGRPPALVAGNDAPQFTLQGLTGPDLSLSNYRGQVVLVNFWATWCPPCRAEMPDMQRVYMERKDRGFAIVAVNIQEAREPISGFVSQYGLTFPIALDTNGEVTQLFGIYSLPTSYFVDKAGRIAEVRAGALTKNDILKKVDALLASPAG